ncbi:neuronal regeneration-related protein [Petaurus breviceps papuanus]|uniref:neuronal regeneration-related protein n=1 Tax=Petaurus breviceps papuanus TaxID=3040969 RepID=UPI0036D9A6EC
MSRLTPQCLKTFFSLSILTQDLLLRTNSLCWSGLISRQSRGWKISQGKKAEAQRHEMDGFRGAGKSENAPVPREVNRKKQDEIAAASLILFSGDGHCSTRINYLYTF